MIVSFGLGIGLGLVVYKNVNNVYNKACTLYQVLKETPKHKNAGWLQPVSTSWGVIQVGLEMVWIYFEQHLRQTCVKHQNVYHVQFVIGNRLYKIIVKPPRGPRASNLECFNNIGQSKTDELTPFIRGLQSQVNLTPKLLGENQLTFVDSFGQTQTFLENEPIQLE